MKTKNTALFIWMDSAFICQKKKYVLESFQVINMYYTYMLRCTDNSIYTGMASDVNKRMSEHFSKDKKGAKYTKSHEAVKVEAVWRSKEKSLACKLEYFIKTLTKSEKEKLIKSNRLSEFLKGKIDCRKYYKMDIRSILDEKYIK